MQIVQVTFSMKQIKKIKIMRKMILIYSIGSLFVFFHTLVINNNGSKCFVGKTEALTFTEHMVYFKSPYYKNMGTVAAKVHCFEELDDEMICKAYDPAGGEHPLDAKGYSWQECFWSDEDLTSIPWQLI